MSAQTPIELEPGVEIVEMSDDEVVACLTSGLISGFGSTGVTHVTSRLAIRITEEWPIRVGESNLSNPGEVEAAYARRVELVEAIVHALRLLKPGETSVPGTVSFSRNEFSPGYHFGFSPAPRHMDFERYRLEAADADELVKLWRTVRDPRVSKKRFLTTAIRRFAFAGERSRSEDQVLDLMIAAEALFTPGTQTEVSHKVALHAAALLSKDGLEPTVVSRTMKRGYGIRSSIAHGGTPSPEDLRHPTGEPATLAEMVELIAGYLRRSLKLMVARAVAGTALADQAAWNELVLTAFRRSK